MRLILYSKPDCHLCEGLQEKLEQVQSPHFELEIRDITTQTAWFDAYQYEIPVLLFAVDDRSAPVPLPRLSPRASVQQVAQLLQKYLPD
jgi:Glutaredoxin-like domain (DUF836)